MTAKEYLSLQKGSVIKYHLEENTFNESVTHTGIIVNKKYDKFIIWWDDWNDLTHEAGNMSADACYSLVLP